MRSRALTQYLLLVGLLATLALTMLYPVWLIVRGGFVDDPVTQTGFSLRHVGLVFRDGVLLEGLRNAFVVAFATTALSFLIGVPLAVFAVRCDFPFKRFWGAAALVPLILPPFVGAIGLRAVIGREGAINSLLGTEWDVLGSARLAGVVVVLALHLYPIIYLNASAALANLDPALDEAALLLGAGAWRRFLTVTLPLIRPGLFAGGTIVFVWAFTELGTPLVFEVNNLTAVQIFHGLKEVSSSAQPFALTVVMLVIAVGSYALGKWGFGRAGHAATTRASVAGSSRRLGWGPGAAVSGLFALVTLLALLPHIGVVLVAITRPGAWHGTPLPRLSDLTLSNFQIALGHPLGFNSIMNSMMLASAAAAIDVLLGLGIAYLVVRSRVRGRAVLDALAMLPLAVPGLVMAFGYVAVTLAWPFGPGDPLEGAIDIVGSNPNPFPLLIIAYAVRRLPYVVRAGVAGLQQAPVELEEAARNLGAGPLRTLRRIVVPLIAANLIAGGLLAFSFAMLEVSDSIILAQQERHYPITKAILLFTERLGDGQAVACAMGVWGMALLTVTLVGVSIVFGKRLGSIFRV